MACSSAAGRDPSSSRCTRPAWRPSMSRSPTTRTSARRSSIWSTGTGASGTTPTSSSGAAIRRDIDSCAGLRPDRDLLRPAESHADRGRPRPCRGAARSRHPFHAADLQQPVPARLRLDGTGGQRHHPHGPRGHPRDEPARHGDRHVACGRAHRPSKRSRSPSAPSRSRTPTRSWWRDTKRNVSRTVLEALAQSGGMLGLSLYPHHLADGSGHHARKLLRHGGRGGRDRRAWRISASGRISARTSPTTVVRWMREGRWMRPDPAPVTFPPQPAWFRDNRDFPAAGRGLARAPASARPTTAAVLGRNWYRFMGEAFGPEPPR